MHILYSTYAEERRARMRDATPVACGIALALILCLGIADILMSWGQSTPLSLGIYLVQLAVPCGTWWLARVIPQRIEALAVAACAVYVVLQCSDLYVLPDRHLADYTILLAGLLIFTAFFVPWRWQSQALYSATATLALTGSAWVGDVTLTAMPIALYCVFAALSCVGAWWVDRLRYHAWDAQLAAAQAHERADAHRQARMYAQRYDGVVLHPDKGLKDMCREYEDHVITTVLRACDGDRKAAAAQLGVTVRTVQLRLAARAKRLH